MKRYHSCESLNIKAIRALHKTLARDVEKFVGLEKKAFQTVTFNALPSLPKPADLPGIRMDDSFVSAELPADDASVKVLAKIMKEHHDSIGRCGVLAVDCSYEELTSNQHPLYCDSIGVWRRRGKWNLACNTLSQSQAWQSTKYRKEYFAKVIKIAALPLVMRETGKKFFLTHKTGGEVTTFLAGFDGENPFGFECELSDVDHADAMRRFCKSIAAVSKRIFNYTWHAGPQAEETSDPLVYDLVQAVRLPAPSGYQLELRHRLESLGGLQSLQSLCSETDRLVTQIGEGVTPTGGKATFHVVTTHEGYWFELQLASATPYAAELAKMLGLTWRMQYPAR
jgi:hypothetical protein